MILKSISYLILLVAFATSCTWVASSGENLIMPEELVELANNNNCSQPNNFFTNKPGPIDPPYLYGVAEGNVEDSAVFWCVRENSKSVLMFMVRGAEGPELVGSLEWLNAPMGLSFYETNTLQGFELIKKEDAIHMPKSKRFEGKFFMSRYDGVSEMFVMKDGLWMVLQRH